MSRIGKAIIHIPADVKVAVDGQNIQVEGKLGKLSTKVHDLIKIKLDGNQLSFERPDDLKFSRSIHGTTRALVANMVEGVSKGFEKNLEIVGVGYRVEQKGKDLNLVLGFSHPVIYKAPEGVELKAVQLKKGKGGALCLQCSLVFQFLFQARCANRFACLQL